MKNKIYRIVGILLLSSLFLNSCNVFAPGTYIDAEYYPIELAEEELIKAISEFKSEYPSYQYLKSQPDGSLTERKDQYRNNIYTVFFSLPDKRLIMHCVIKRGTDKSVRLGLHAVHNTAFGIKIINTSELTKKENREYKEIFEKEVLTPLKDYLNILVSFND